MDRNDFSDFAVACQFDGCFEFSAVVRALLCTCLEDTAGSSDFVDNVSGFSDSEGQWFFAVDILSSVCACDAHGCVPVVRGSDEHGVDVLSLYEVSEIAVGLAAVVGTCLYFVCVCIFSEVFCVLDASFVHVADGDDLHVIASEEASEVRRRHAAGTDDADIDSVVR